MMQLVIGTALGFMVAQAVLYFLNRAVGWIRYGNLTRGLREHSPVRGSAFLGGFIKYASLLGGSAALITFGVWSVEDYMAAKATRSAATLKVPDISSVAAEPSPAAFKQTVAVPPPLPPESDDSSDNPIDPYADAGFKVQRARHRAGATQSLKDALVERSETKARDDLLRETRQHAQRSQYDCEAANRASRYVRAGLDVWGFAAWQLKYFPTEGYKGATQEACKDIKNVLDPASAQTLSAAAEQRSP